MHCPECGAKVKGYDPKAPMWNVMDKSTHREHELQLTAPGTYSAMTITCYHTPSGAQSVNWSIMDYKSLIFFGFMAPEPEPQKPTMRQGELFANPKKKGGETDESKDTA